MKIAIFSEYFEHDNNSAGRHMSDLTLEICNHADNVDVYSLFNHSEKEGINWPKNVNIYSLEMNPLSKSKSFKRRFFSELSISFKALLKILKMGKLRYYDAVIWYSPTIFWAPIIYIIHKKKNIKKYLILRDIFPQWAVDLEILKENSFKHKILKSFEHFQYSVADTIAIQTEANIRYFDKNESFKDKVTILRTWYDSQDKFIPIPKNIINEIPIEKNLILYAGNLGIAQDAEFLLKIVKNMKNFEKIHFLFIGLKKDQNERISKFTDEHLLTNVTVFPSMDKDKLNSICAISKIGIFCLDQRHTTSNVPGKFLQYISCGLPVFGLCANDDLENLIKVKKLGKTYRGNDPFEAINCMNDLIDDIENNKIKSEHLKRYVSSELSTKSASKNILSSFI